MRIIPAIDIIDGQCVRLVKGDYASKTTYSKDPLEMAKRFEDHGLKYLHFVDLDGAKSKTLVHHALLESICTKTNLKVDFGGGIRNDKDIRIAFESGAHQVSCGSIAVEEPKRFKNWLDRYGQNKIILSADCKNKQIAKSAWLDITDHGVVQFIQSYEKEKILYVMCTDITKDGMLNGPSIQLYKEILDKTNIKLIASGGVSNMNDIKALKEINCEAVIIGKAIYEGNISLKQLEKLC